MHLIIFSSTLNLFYVNQPFLQHTFFTTSLFLQHAKQRWCNADELFLKESTIALHDLILSSIYCVIGHILDSFNWVWLLHILQLPAEPLKTFYQPLPRGRTCGLHKNVLNALASRITSAIQYQSLLPGCYDCHNNNRVFVCQLAKCLLVTQLQLYSCCKSLVVGLLQIKQQQSASYKSNININII